MYSLTIYKGDDHYKVESLGSRKAFSIGRHPLNDICLEDPSSSISRFHAALFLDAEGHYFLQDLGSKNNTYVNGKKREYGILNEGDRIQIGDYDLVFEKSTVKGKKKKPTLAVVEDKGKQHTKTVISPFSFKREEINKLKDKPEGLLLLYNLNRLENEGQELEESLQLVCEVLFEAFKPDRVLVALFEHDSENLACLGRYPDEKGESKVSRTMIRHLLDKKRMFIARDALDDERLKKKGKTAKSVLELQLKSIACIPLQWDGDVKGILYLDSTKKAGLFDESQAQLLSLIGDDLSLYIENTLHHKRVQDERTRLQTRLEMEDTLIGLSPDMQDALKYVAKIADTDASVLITGETGTGKDLLAKVLHQNSRRKGKPFIQVNCAAIPKNLLESEMFGVIANYPGFHNNEPLKGRFVLAHGGTIFLNEIGELSATLQARFLDVLDNMNVWPLGAKEAVPVDIRVIAATNRDIKKEVSEGRFREDLYARLNVMSLELPPLRKRKEDIPLLAGYFLFCLRQKHGKRINRFSPACIQRLSSYDWPRNIRELKHSIERAMILSNSKELTPRLFDLEKHGASRFKSLRDMEREYIKEVLAYTGGNKEKAIRILGIAKQTLYNKGKEFGLTGFNDS